MTLLGVWTVTTYLGLLWNPRFHYRKMIPVCFGLWIQGLVGFVLKLYDKC